MPLPVIQIRHSEMPREHKPMQILGGEIEIVSDDGRALFAIRQLPNGSIEISTGLACVKHNDIVLDSALAVLPKGNGTIIVTRLPYEGN